MLLPAFALLLNLLLLLQLLRDAGLSQGLALASLVGLGVKGGLQSRVTTHTHHHLLTQLWRDKYTNMDHRKHADVTLWRWKCWMTWCVPVSGSSTVGGL